MPLFHYTDVQAVQSILLNQKLWLTDLRFMNDSTELQHGIEFFKEALKHQPYGLFYNAAHAAPAIDYVRDSLSRYEDAERQDEPVFAMSFSEVDDLLSQWRGYGGYSIAFDRERLEERGLNLKSCMYDDASKAGHAMSDLSRAVSAISNSMATDDGRGYITAIDEVTKLIERAATFKDAGFAEEREVRLISDSDSEKKVKFRTRQGILIPYIEIDIPREAIVGIRVGPIRNQDLASLSMQMFAQQMESDHQANAGDIEWCVPVAKSLTPFRA